MFLHIQGTHEKFQLKITALTDIEHNSELLYAVQIADGHRNRPDQLSLKPFKNNETRTIDTVKIPLYYSGDSFLTIWEVGKNKPQTIFIFHVTSRNNLVLAGLAAIIATIIAIVF
jgi:hypothetical protein